MSGPLDIFAPLPRIEQSLQACCAAMDVPAPLRDAVRYALLGGGKRLRPLLAWHAAEAVGGAGERSLCAGVAIELIHAFSLVHDDLPAMDNDDLRRGKPTLHVHAGQAMAILAGDQMLAGAFEHVLLHAGSPSLGAALGTELARGARGMIGGQVLDTLGGFAGAPDDAEKLRQIHTSKTGALIRAAARMGAMCGLENAQTEKDLDAVTRYADAVGLAFQIVDDLLDVEGTPEQIGKRTGKDVQAGKLTYPGVLGVEASRREVARQLAVASGALSGLPGRTAGLRGIAEFVAARTH